MTRFTTPKPKLKAPVGFVPKNEQPDRFHTIMDYTVPQPNNPPRAELARPDGQVGLGGIQYKAGQMPVPFNKMAGSPGMQKLPNKFSVDPSGIGRSTEGAGLSQLPNRFSVDPSGIGRTASSLFREGVVPLKNMMPDATSTNAIESFGMRALGGSTSALESIRRAMGASLPSSDTLSETGKRVLGGMSPSPSPTPGVQGYGSSSASAYTPALTGPPEPPARPATAANYGQAAQALGILPFGAQVGSIVPSLATMGARAVERSLQQAKEPMNNAAGDVRSYDAARAARLPPQLARGSVMGDASLRGDMDASGMPGPMARALDTNRAITNIQAEERSRNRSVRDPKSMVGNRTGIAPINVAIEEQRQADDAAQMESIRNNRKDFYQKKYEEAGKGQTMDVKPTIDHVRLADRLNKRGYNVTPEQVAQKEAQDKANRAAVKAQNEELYAATGGVSPRRQQIRLRKEAERQATEERKAQARNVRFNALQQDRYGMMPDQGLAAQRLSQMAPGAALQAMGLNSRAQGEMGLRQQELDQKEQAMQIGQANAMLASAAEIEATDPQTAQQLRQSAVSLFRPPAAAQGMAQMPIQAAPSAGLVQQAEAAAQQANGLSPAEMLTQFGPVLSSVGSPGFSPEQALQAGLTPEILQRIEGYSPSLPYRVNADPATPFTGLTDVLDAQGLLTVPWKMFGEGKDDFMKRRSLQANAKKLREMIEARKQGK